MMIIDNVHLSKHLWVKGAQLPDTHSPSKSSLLCRLSVVFAASPMMWGVTSDNMTLTLFFTKRFQALPLWSTSSPPVPPGGEKLGWLSQYIRHCHKFLRGRPLLTSVARRAPTHMLCTQRKVYCLVIEKGTFWFGEPSKKIWPKLGFCPNRS